MQLLNTLAVRAIPWIPRALVHKISRRYIAGSTLSQALVRVQQLNAQGFPVTLDILGEAVSSLPQAQVTADAYIELLGAIAARGLQAIFPSSPRRWGCCWMLPGANTSPAAFWMLRSAITTPFASTWKTCAARKRK